MQQIYNFEDPETPQIKKPAKWVLWLQLPQGPEVIQGRLRRLSRSPHLGDLSSEW